MDINITCLCSSSQQTVSLKATSFPISEEICHCNPCRHSSGSIGGIFLSLSSPPRKLSSFKSYKTSDRLERLFCKKCGTHVFVHTFEGDTWSVCAGTVDIDGKEDDCVKITEHAYVSDTKDGGWAAWLLKINGREVPCYDEDASVKKITIEPATVGPTPLDPSEEKCLIKCHCGGVECYLHRSETPYVPLSDDKSRYESTWWLFSGGKKFRGSMCGCRSCRLALGQPLQPWAFCEEKDIRHADGKPVDFEKGWGTMETYESSPGIFRSFCGTCGASIAYRNKPRAEMVGHEVIDVSVGVIRAESGVRAENWIEWPFDRLGCDAAGLERELINTMLEHGKKKTEENSEVKAQ